MTLPKPFQHKCYFYNVLIALDELGNTLVGGSPHETMSAHAYRSQQAGSVIGAIVVPVINTVFRIFEKDHCRQAYLISLSRNNLPGIELA